MFDLVQIRLNDKEAFYNNAESREKLNLILLDIIKNTKEFQTWDDTIKAIILTDDFRNAVHEQISLWNIKDSISQEKEDIVISKTLFNGDYNNPEHFIFLDINLFFNNLPVRRMIFGQIVNIASNRIFPDDIRERKFLDEPGTLENFIKFYSTGWCKALYTKRFLDKTFIDKTPVKNQQKYLTAFKRKLKRNLFEYNSDKDNKQALLTLFSRNYFNSIDILFLRLIETETEDISLMISENEPCKKYIDKIIYEINQLMENTTNTKVFDVNPLKNSIKDFSAYFEVILDNETNENFKITLTKNPKDYFNGEIVETEPRMVCFMDILGFSELINQYEKDITSTLLQDIQESFATTKSQLLENDTLKKESVKHLQYQTFSDNICISIPYFDNEEDFVANFNLLSVYVRSFQLTMMSKGLFMRGGISIGSYYADQNIIFSKGLVNAYYLESKKAIYPRVIIDNIIIKKLLNYTEKKIKYFGLDQTIIFDWENSAFLNPFGMIEIATRQVESIMSEIGFAEKDDEFSKAMDSITKTIGNFTANIFRENSENEKQNLADIKNLVEDNIYLYENDSNIANKYQWLLEFINWFEGSQETKLKFSFMSEKIEHMNNAIS